MNSEERLAVVTAIHRSPTMLVLAVAGGGNAVITDLLDVPGASRTVLEISVPYAEAALADLVGAAMIGGGAGIVSSAMAEAMAVACLDRARLLASDGGPLLGVAVTAALVSDRPKKGEHRAHVAVADDEGVHSTKIALIKGELDRRGEDRVVADAVLGEIAARAGAGPNEVGHSEVGHSEVGHSEVGHSEVGQNEVFRNEVGHNEVGTSTVEPDRGGHQSL